MARRNPGEPMFEGYLDVHGYSWDYESFEDEITTNADYRVTRVDGQQLVCEVEGFETEGIMTEAASRPGEVVSRPLKKALQPIRGRMKSAARQLRPLAGHGFPLVIVLANPLQRALPLTPELLMSAMYGDLKPRSH